MLDQFHANEDGIFEYVLSRVDSAFGRFVEDLVGSHEHHAHHAREEVNDSRMSCSSMEHCLDDSFKASDSEDDEENEEDDVEDVVNKYLGTATGLLGMATQQVMEAMTPRPRSTLAAAPGVPGAPPGLGMMKRQASVYFQFDMDGDDAKRIQNRKGMLLVPRDGSPLRTGGATHGSSSSSARFLGDDDDEPPQVLQQPVGCGAAVGGGRTHHDNDDDNHLSSDGDSDGDGDEVALGLQRNEASANSSFSNVNSNQVASDVVLTALSSNDSTCSTVSTHLNGSLETGNNGSVIACDALEHAEDAPSSNHTPPEAQKIGTNRLLPPPSLDSPLRCDLGAENRDINASGSFSSKRKPAPLSLSPPSHPTPAHSQQVEPLTASLPAISPLSPSPALDQMCPHYTPIASAASSPATTPVSLVAASPSSPPPSTRRLDKISEHDVDFTYIKSPYMPCATPSRTSSTGSEDKNKNCAKKKRKRRHTREGEYSVARSKTVWKNLDPVWDQHLELEVLGGFLNEEGEYLNRTAPFTRLRVQVLSHFLSLSLSLSPSFSARACTIARLYVSLVY
jgi:hypothetical protein